MLKDIAFVSQYIDLPEPKPGGASPLRVQTDALWKECKEVEDLQTLVQKLSRMKPSRRVTRLIAMADGLLEGINILFPNEREQELIASNKSLLKDLDEARHSLEESQDCICDLSNKLTSIEKHVGVADSTIKSMDSRLKEKELVSDRLGDQLAFQKVRSRRYCAISIVGFMLFLIILIYKKESLHLIGENLNQHSSVRPTLCHIPHTFQRA
jgi:uncharacterized coiled-coil protein SlyX